MIQFKNLRQFKTAISTAIFVVAMLGLISSGTQHSPTPYRLQYDTGKFGEPKIPEDNPTTVEGIRLGRLLFYDSVLSGNHKQSCGSCHLQKYSFSDGKKLAVGSKGDTINRNTMSLVNLAWSGIFFWDGRAKTLESLVRFPVTNSLEMGKDTIQLVAELHHHAKYPQLFESAFPGQQISMENISKAIAQFLRTIQSRGVYVSDSMKLVLPAARNKEAMNKYAMQMNKDESMRGTFFRVANMCGKCHDGPGYGGNILARNFVQPGDTPIKAPSLVNILYTAPYMHDGRFNTLTEVLEHYDKHFEKLKTVNNFMQEDTVNVLTSFDKKNIERFFQVLTDSNLLTNPAYSNPFLEPDFNWYNN